MSHMSSIVIMELIKFITSGYIFNQFSKMRHAILIVFGATKIKIWSQSETPGEELILKIGIQQKFLVLVLHLVRYI